MKRKNLSSAAKGGSRSSMSSSSQSPIIGSSSSALSSPCSSSSSSSSPCSSSSSSFTSTAPSSAEHASSGSSSSSSVTVCSSHSTNTATFARKHGNSLSHAYVEVTSSCSPSSSSDFDGSVISALPALDTASGSGTSSIDWYSRKRTDPRSKFRTEKDDHSSSSENRRDENTKQPGSASRPTKASRLSKFSDEDDGECVSLLAETTSSIVHVELQLKPGVSVKDNALDALRKLYPVLVQQLPSDQMLSSLISVPVPHGWKTVLAIFFEADSLPCDLLNAKPLFHFYTLDQEGAADEVDETDPELTIFHEWSLPSQDLHGLWPSLVFDESVKKNLLGYLSASAVYARLDIDTSLITHNRILLLHGPPGTGKTSLCRALAQKLAIRHQEDFAHFQLIEVNAHSLFSKWFSESGKLVMKLFGKIREFAEDSDTFVCVLIDEVESLTAARSAAMSGSEPTDSIRVVNALLTQLDQLKRYRNVLVFTTSNLSTAIDLAFVDRADLKMYIGPPGFEARYDILRSCIGTLATTSLLHDAELEQSQVLSLHQLQTTEPNAALPLATRLLVLVAKQTEGLSGRALRKLPFITQTLEFGAIASISTVTFIRGMCRAAKKESQARSWFTCETD